MSDPRKHELHAYLGQDLDTLRDEYRRIFSRATEDPGTAGDEGEANWAKLLSDWLPESYKVVTKGRLLGADGQTSGQVDVIVLKPAYPRRLLDKKLYLVSGVAAAFECKLTLKSGHLKKAARTAVTIRRLSGPVVGSPYCELVASPVFGLFAHSHSWKTAGSVARQNVHDALTDIHFSASHPRDLLDLVCVADLGTWALHRETNFDDLDKDEFDDLTPFVGTFYNTWPQDFEDEPGPNPVAVAIVTLLEHLGWSDTSVQPLADYFHNALSVGTRFGYMRRWEFDDVYSPAVAQRVRRGKINDRLWNEWSRHLPS